MRPIIYDVASQFLCDNKSPEFQKHFEHLNETLADEKAYIQYVNDFCCELLPKYMDQFTRGGAGKQFFSKGFLKGIGDVLKGRGFFNKANSYNNYNCESYRWAIIRAMQLKYKL